MDKDYKLNVETLGQVFTPKTIVDYMISLIRNNGNVLEPSCGDGAFSNSLENCTSIEFDEHVCPPYALNMDFFDYDESNKFDTIIGNPPYVRYQDICLETKMKLDKTYFDERTNLYLFFIYKCILHLKNHGELIFIVPRDFLKNTSAIKLNEFIYENGTITDFLELGDKRIFDGAYPNTVIFRFEKNNFSRKCNDKTFLCKNGQLLFLKNQYSIPFNDLFFVKVGAVSGDDKIFINEKGNLDFVCSYTRKNGKTKKMFYNIEHSYLLQFKERLINRKIKKFDENSWYMWGRNYFVSDLPRIYVNGKTRTENPFFYHSCKAYDGSVLAIFPKFHVTEDVISEVVNDLNNVSWDDLGFVCDGRYIFSQRSLEQTLLPDIFKKYIKK